MIFAALNEAAEKGELILIFGGLCRFHKRRDGVVVVREILIVPKFRRTGLGRILIEEVRRRNPGSPLLAKCPARYESNGFWKAVGFELVETNKGINTWRLPG